MKPASMKVAFGLRAHSGWAALVVLGEQGRDLVVVDRRRVELVADAWAKAPYHASEGLAREAARGLVERGIEAARRNAVHALRSSVESERGQGHDVAACAVLMGSPMPAWSTEEILAVHFRMHKAEGTIFREALARAAGECGLRLVAIPEKQLAEYAERALGKPASLLAKEIASLGRTVGPPWGKDQKDAALAALVALRGVKE